MIDSAAGTRPPKLSYLVKSDLLQALLGYFTERTGVRVWFQDSTGYTVAPQTRVPTFCSMLLNHGRCGLANPEVDMPHDPSLPVLRTCMGGIGHVIIPVVSTSAEGAPRELGRLITEPLATRETAFSETFAEAQRMHIHPDNLAAAARDIRSVDRNELTQLSRIVATAVERIAAESTARTRIIEVAEAFEEVGLRGNRDIVNQLLTVVVREFSDADAAILTSGSSVETSSHDAAFAADLDGSTRTLLEEFTGAVVHWIARTDRPISFPDLGGSAWCKHVLGGRALEGALVSVPVKLPGAASGWWTAYYRHPVATMEDELHKLLVLAAQSAQTLGFLDQLESSREAAMTDSLTGLYNRRFLVEQLDRELARSVRARYPVSLVIFDLDNFKEINDSHGHLTGDEALKFVADVLREPLRRSSTIYRYGGDEFCVVVPECTREEAERVALRLKSEIESRPFEAPGVGPIELRVSGGVATQEPEGPPDQDLFELADQVLIRAKRSGKSRIGTA